MPENLTSNQLSSEDAVALLRKQEGFILTHLNAQRLILFIERLQRQVDALSIHASKWVTRALELQQRAAPEPPAVRRWDIRPAFGDGVDFLADPAGEWVKWEDVLPHLRTTQPPTEPLCPRPFTGRPDIFTMAQCILAGECGCTVAACEARKFQPPEEPTHIGDTEGMFRYFGASQPPAAAQHVIEAAIVWRRSPPSYHTTNQALRDAVDRYTSETKGDSQ